MSFKLKEDKRCHNCGTMLYLRDCKHLSCEGGSGRCLDCDNDRAQYDYLDSPNHEKHSHDRCRWGQAVDAKHDAEQRGYARGYAAGKREGIEAAAKRVEEFRFFSGNGADMANTIRALLQAEAQAPRKEGET